MFKNCKSLTSTVHTKTIGEKTNNRYTPLNDNKNVRMPNLPLIPTQIDYYINVIIKQSKTTTYWTNNNQLFSDIFIYK